ncbi:FabG Dehydrogenases with different specificities (related to short-chain alcohol dehydrogenases) [Candidatus Nanopelagicaceae bacterium]
MSSQSTRPLAIVTGGSRGLGFEVAKALTLQGFDIALIAKDEQRLESAANLIRESDRYHNGVSTSHISTFVCDLEKPDLVRELIDSLNQSLATPTVLVLAHGVMSEKMSKTLKTNDDEWRRVMAINLDSVFQLVNGIAPAMADARNGRIIIFSACLGRMSGPGNAGGLAPYRISKAGVNALVRNLAHETGLGARGFLVDATCPNHSRTDMGGPDAPRSAEEGAATAIWLATREFNAGDITGVLWEDKQIVEW